MAEIIPAILPSSVLDLEKKLTEIPSEINFFHFDVLDQDIWTETDVDFEAHLMVSNISEVAPLWIERGARRLTLHTLGGRTAKWREEVEIGLAVELHIPLEDIFPLVSEIDFIHLMSIAQIGKQGYPFDERIFDRIKEVRTKFPQLPISVDGGINTTNYQKLIDLGVERLVVGSGFKELWNSLMKK
jgi:ribulose-phosphate 3-epimerase